MNSIPRTKFSPTKSKYSILVEQISRAQEEVIKLRQEMKSLIEAEVQKSLGDKISMIDGALTETILQKEVLIERGLMTREEINAKYASLKAQGAQ
jgi:DNA-binding protein H-NS